MRILIAAAILAATTGFAAAEFYVVQNIQTRQCSIENEYPVTASAKILLNNKFNERADAEAAMKDVPVCN
jgi:hypothetical protein